MTPSTKARHNTLHTPLCPPRVRRSGWQNSEIHITSLNITPTWHTTKNKHHTADTNTHTNTIVPQTATTHPIQHHTIGMFRLRTHTHRTRSTLPHIHNTNIPIPGTLQRHTQTFDKFLNTHTSTTIWMNTPKEHTTFHSYLTDQHQIVRYTTYRQHTHSHHNWLSSYTPHA